MVLDRAVVFDLEARLALREGVDLVANAVKVTMGPKGRNVAYKPSLGPPTVTNDGVTVARDIKVENTFLHTGAQIVYEACRQTNTVAGDGTTTAAVLTQAMYSEAFKAIMAGANPMIIRRGMDPALAEAESALYQQAVRAESRQEVAWMAGMSANDPFVGELIADVFERQGVEGAITVDEGKSLKTEITYVDGMRLDTGFLSAHFATDTAETEALIENPDILITDREIEHLRDFLPFLEQYAASGRKKLVIVAKQLIGEVVTMLATNKQAGNLEVICVKAPVFGQRQRWMLEDLAIFTGGTIVGHETGEQWRAIGLDVLGTAERVRCTKEQTFFVKGAGDPMAIRERVEYIWMQHGRMKNHFDREKHQERANNLTGSFAEIWVGAASAVERFELRHRIEDAISATRAGLDEGIVPGGGTALARASEAIKDDPALPRDEAIGRRIVRDALRMPLEVIADNAGYDGAVAVDEVLQLEGRMGFNAATGEYEDLVAIGVIDPLKVTRSALRNAGSAAAMLITSEAVVGDSPSYHRWNEHYRERVATKHGFYLDEPSESLGSE
ncbi:MAG: molecular chaperone GroEL [Chloroflexota bacterium]|nr:molecular chaperone GroEL [Chloroflexota bacterium]